MLNNLATQCDLDLGTQEFPRNLTFGKYKELLAASIPHPIPNKIGRGKNEKAPQVEIAIDRTHYQVKLTVHVQTFQLPGLWGVSPGYLRA